MHDSGFRFQAPRPFPEHADQGLGKHFHVGANIGSVAVGGQISRPDGARLFCRLRNEQGRATVLFVDEVHANAVTKGGWQVDLLPA